MHGDARAELGKSPSLRLSARRSRLLSKGVYGLNRRDKIEIVTVRSGFAGS